MASSGASTSNNGTPTSSSDDAEMAISDDDVVLVGDTLYHEARLGVYSRREQTLSGRPTYQLRRQTGRSLPSSRRTPGWTWPATWGAARPTC